MVRMVMRAVYLHICNRCGKDFESKFEAPLRCGKCKSPYWNRERTR